MIRPSALGDVCRSVPVVVSLRRAFPDAEIDWLVQTAFVDAVRHHPDLTRVIPFPRRRLGKRRIWRAEGREALRGLLRALRGRPGLPYDLAIDCQGLGRSGLFAWLTGAPRRVGFANARELAWLGYTERHRVSPDLHTVDRMLALLEGAGVAPVCDLTLHTSAEDRAAIDPRLAGAHFAVVAPTSRWEGKRWPAERFAAVVRTMLDDLRFGAVAIVAAEHERDQCAEVLDLARRDPRVVDLVGRTSVGGLMALIEASCFVLANDSAALHMAVGFRKPLLGLYGPTRIDLVGPYARAADVVQPVVPRRGITHKHAEAGGAMMRRITVEEVVAAVAERAAPPHDTHEPEGSGHGADDAAHAPRTMP